ncbi:MAG: type II toxin-antitoxin system RelE/ParE family toxin [Cyclobacteriaceae bacterium]
MKRYVAFRGEAFQIEWYYDDRGESRALEYAENELSKIEKARLLLLFERMGEYGMIRDKTKFRSEGDGIFAFKPKPHRFLCFFFKGGKIIITNGFKKRQDELPVQEKKRALAIKQAYEHRTYKGEYYEK